MQEQCNEYDLAILPIVMFLSVIVIDVVVLGWGGGRGRGGSSTCRRSYL